MSSLVNKRASWPKGSGENFCLSLLAPGRGQLTPARMKLTKQVSLGKYNFILDPVATNSTNATVLPALCRKGRNCFAFEGS
jgi:hypothetical protein